MREYASLTVCITSLLITALPASAQESKPDVPPVPPGTTATTTVEKVETKPDGTVVTTKTTTVSSSAKQSTNANGEPKSVHRGLSGVPESGFEKSRFRLSIGRSYSVYDNKGNSISLSDTGLTISQVKFDISYFRPTRHEALISLWYLRSEFEDTFDFGESSYRVKVKNDSTVVTTEYRWRFGGHGIAWFGIGAGYSQKSLLKDSGSFVSTGTIGVDIGPIFLESRSLYFSEDEGGLSNIFLGVKF